MDASDTPSQQAEPERVAAEDDERRVIWVQFVQEETGPAAAADPFQEGSVPATRSALKRNGDARSLTEAIEAAAGGAERLQQQVIRDRLSGLEARVADSQVMLRRQAKVLRQLRIGVYVTLFVAVVAGIACFVAVVT